MAVSIYFYVKDKIHIIAKLVNKSLYFTRKKFDAQRQRVIFFHINSLLFVTTKGAVQGRFGAEGSVVYHGSLHIIKIQRIVHQNF